MRSPRNTGSDGRESASNRRGVSDQERKRAGDVGRRVARRAGEESRRGRRVYELERERRRGVREVGKVTTPGSAAAASGAFRAPAPRSRRTSACRGIRRRASAWTAGPACRAQHEFAITLSAQHDAACGQFISAQRQIAMGPGRRTPGRIAPIRRTWRLRRIDSSLCLLLHPASICHAGVATRRRRV